MLRNMLGRVVGVMLTFLELAKMVDATQHVGSGGGGVMLTFFKLNLLRWLMLRNMLGGVGGDVTVP